MNNKTASTPASSSFDSPPREDAILDGRHYRSEPEEVIASLQQYAPNGSEREWLAIREFVFDAAVLTAAASSYPADRVLKITAGFVRWAVTEQGLTLESTAIFSRRLIEFYCNSLNLSDGSIATYRSVLARVTEVVAPSDSVTEFTPIRRRVIQAPYSDKEMNSVVAWAKGQPTAIGRHNARAMLALIAGAGLRPAEILLVQPADIVSDAYGVTVTVRGATARMVPVSYEWEKWAIQIATDRPAGRPLWGAPGRTVKNKNFINEFATSSAGEAPNSARLRATWILSHLKASTPMKDLQRAAGFTKFDNLHHYLEYIEAANDIDYRRALRGAGRS